MEIILSLHGFSTAEFGNTGPHATQYGTPREDTVLMPEARGVLAVLFASARSDRATGVPIGMERNPGGDVCLRSPPSTLKPLYRVDACGICLSVYWPCCHRLSNEDRVRVLTPRERNCSGNGHSSATGRDGRHKSPNVNYSSSRSSLRDVGARGQLISAAPSGNDDRHGKKWETRRSRNGKKVPIESESEQVPSRERRITPGGLVATTPKTDLYEVNAEDPEGERGNIPCGLVKRRPEALLWGNVREDVVRPKGTAKVQPEAPWWEIVPLGSTEAPFR